MSEGFGRREIEGLEEGGVLWSLGLCSVDCGGSRGFSREQGLGWGWCFVCGLSSLLLIFSLPLLREELFEE